MESARTDKFPDTLYHYTSSQVLLSILEKRAIWLSSRTHLNDWREGEVFLKHIDEYAEAQKASAEQLHSVTTRLKHLEFYVNCMTSKGDVLSQWRGYANGGGGVAIGFNTKALLAQIGGGSAALLERVVYADAWTELPGEMQSTIAALFRSTGEPKGDFVRTLVKLRALVKNKAFAEEDEFRLILTPEDALTVRFKSGAVADQKFRATETDIREYYSLSFHGDDLSSLVCEIVLGPKNTTQESALRRKLRESGLGSVQVRNSEASFR